MSEQLTQKEIEVRELFEKFFVHVSELPMKEQVRALKEFQDFLAEVSKKQRSVSN